MKLREIGSHEVPEIGLGCMNLSHAYGTKPTEEEAIKVLHGALDLGVKHFDTAALYGFGANETLLGKALKGKRQDIHLASKCAMTGVDGKRVIDGRPETLAKTIDEALTRLQTDFIDLYYLHRWDKNVPIEDSVGAVAKMIEAGKVGAIGLSEVSANTIVKANAEHAITAVQTEYSLWTRNAEISVLDTCAELGITFVAFSPVARGFLANGVSSVSDLIEGDIRRGMPRFQEPNFSANMQWIPEYHAIAQEVGCSPAQLALAWVLQQRDFIIPIPGTRSLAHLEENLGAADIVLGDDVLARLDNLINQNTVNGPRYPAPTQAEIDTEEF
jgi:aryl-alcohol dehydrogenase-like predicted oxidoreductase